MAASHANPEGGAKGLGGRRLALVVEPDPPTRSALRALLESSGEFNAVGEAGDSGSVVAWTLQRHADMVLLGPSVEHETRLQVIRTLAREVPSCRTLVLAPHTGGADARELLRAGAAGYVLARSALQELVPAVRTVVRGGLHVSPQVGAQLAADKRSDDPAKLTRRELQVLRCLSRGYTNAEIAEIYTLSVRTVEAHRARLQRKLTVTSRASLVREATARGLLDDGP